MNCIDLEPQCVRNAKKAFSTRRVIEQDADCLIVGDYRPRAGDLVLASVKALGQHTGVQLWNGRRSRIYPGERLLLAYGSRYAPDQFEALIPEDLGPCDLAAAGGLASRVVAAHSRMKRPTSLQVDGILARQGGTPLNLKQYALPCIGGAATIPAIAVVGTSMNAGKTTTAAAVVRGFTQAGLRVGAAKITGTGACADFFALQDAGAEVVWDFTDAGHVTTYGIEVADVVGITKIVLSQIQAKGCHIAVLEIADGVFQRETAAFLDTAYAREVLHGLLFAAGDAAGAVAGGQWLQQRGHHLLGFSGVMTQSELQMREAAQVTGVPVFTVQALQDVNKASALLPSATALAEAS